MTLLSNAVWAFWFQKKSRYPKTSSRITILVNFQLQASPKLFSHDWNESFIASGECNNPAYRASESFWLEKLHSPELKFEQLQQIISKLFFTWLVLTFANGFTEVKAQRLKCIWSPRNGHQQINCFREWHLHDRGDRQGGELEKLWLENYLVADLLRSRWQRFLSSVFLPQHHLEPVWYILWDMCPGWRLASAHCPSLWHFSLALVLTQELCFSIWHLTVQWQSSASSSIISMLRVGPQRWRWCPWCLWLLCCPAGAMKSGWITLMGSQVLWGNRVQPQWAPSGMFHVARSVPSLLRLQQNRLCSRSTGASLGDKGGSHLCCICRGRVDPNTDYPVFLAWVFLPLGTTLSAPVQSCCTSWQCRRLGDQGSSAK